MIATILQYNTARNKEPLAVLPNDTEERKEEEKADRMMNISMIGDYIEEFDISYCSHVY